MREISDEEIQLLGLKKETCFQRSGPKPRSPAAERKNQERLRKRRAGLKRFEADVSPDLLPLMKLARDNESAIRHGGVLPSTESAPDFVTLTIRIPKELERVCRLVFNADSVSGHMPEEANKSFETFNYDATWPVTCPPLNSHTSVELWISQVLLSLDRPPPPARPAANGKIKTTTVPKEVLIGRRYYLASEVWQALISSVVATAPLPGGSGIPPNASDAFFIRGYILCSLPPIRRWIVMRMLDLAH